MLSNEEIVVKIQEAAVNGIKDDALISELWQRNIGLIRFNITKISGLKRTDYGFEDLEQQSYFGFYQAIKSYDINKGCKFSSFFSKTVKWEICRYYDRNAFTIRIPPFMRKRIGECIKKRQELEKATGHSVDNRTVLKTMGLHDVSVNTTLSTMNKLRVTSIYEPICNSDGDEDAVLLDIINGGEDVEERAIAQKWHQELHELLMNALQELPEKTRSIIYRRYFLGISAKSLAEEYGVSLEAIRARTMSGFRKIREGPYSAELAEYLPFRYKPSYCKNKIDDKLRQQAIEKLLQRRCELEKRREESA